MKHLRWEKSGRLFDHSDIGDPNTYTFVTGIGHKNVDVGDGSFAPYVVSGASLKHGDSEYNFSDGWQELRYVGQIITSKSRLYVARNVSGAWTDIPHGIPTRNIVHDYPREGRCTAYLDFPNIQGYAQGSRLQVGVEVGGDDRQTYGFRLRSPVAGIFRLEWVLEIPQNVDIEWLEAATSPTDSTPVRIGIRLGQNEIRWSRAEAPFRSATSEIVQDGRILRIFLGPYTVNAMEWLTIYPDVWGATSLAATGDDGTETATAGTWNAAGYYENHNMIGNRGESSGLTHIGLRWVNVTVSNGASVSNAHIDIHCDAYDAAGTPTATMYGADADNQAQWSSTIRPSTVTKTTASTSANPRTTAGWQEIVVTDIVSEIVARAGWSSGNAMSFAWICTNASTEHHAWFPDYGYWDYATNPTQLTITYTAGGAASGKPYYAYAQQQ